jgi:hypothetical protein
MKAPTNYGMGIVCFPKSIEVNQDLVVPYFSALKEKAIRDGYTIVHEDGSEPYAVNRSGHRYEIDEIQKSAGRIMDFIDDESPKELVAFFQECERTIYNHLLMYIEMYPRVLSNIWWMETGHVAAYGAGSGLGLHNDNEVNYQVGFEPDLQLATRHVLSALLYLNSSVGDKKELGKHEYSGGEIEFIYANAVHQPKSGDLLIFPSNYLGTHQVKPCLSGERYVYISYFSHGSADSERGIQPGRPVPVGKQSQVWLPTIVDDYVSYIKDKHSSSDLMSFMGGVLNQNHSSSTKHHLPQNRGAVNE